tara:strand:- start:414 stop:806 length:393 start_codon:yes stop_codon:yes gene_type:complete
MNIFIFSLIYFSLSDKHFSGINIIEETIRQEILRKNLTSQIKESFDVNVDVLKRKDEKIVEQETTEIKMSIEEEEIEKLKPSNIQQYFNRFYFSSVTGTTLGYGDIYPRTNLCKIITVLQLFITIAIVIY